MAKAAQKLVLNPSENIPYDQLVLSQKNVRHVRPLSDGLIFDLTAQRMLALRNALAADPDIAFVAAVHAFVLQRFYHAPSDSCLAADLHLVNDLQQLRVSTTTFRIGIGLSERCGSMAGRSGSRATS